MKERGDRFLECYFGAVQKEYPFEKELDGTVLRVFPWWPNKFVHLEVTEEKLQDYWGWEFSFIGTGFSVHFDCRHCNTELLLHFSRSLEASLGELKKQLGQDIYLPGRWNSRKKELRIIEDMCRVPERDNCHILVGCRLAQYTAALESCVEDLLSDFGYKSSPKSPRNCFSNRANLSFNRHSRVA